MKKILIVEDDATIHDLIKEILINAHYKVLDAYSGTEALMILKKENIDLVLLDLMLPGLNGESLIKKVKNIPIIVISAKISVEDKVNVLLNGANDYITKPFARDELLARIQVQLRLNAGKSNNTELRYKDIILEEDKHSMHIINEEIHLTKTEFAILKQLILNPKHVITKTKILDLISRRHTGL